MEPTLLSASRQASSSGKIRSILLIDDDEITNFYNQHIIKKMGLTSHVHFELHGEAGLRYLTQKTAHSPDYQKPDLILLDINMPVMNGFEFLDACEKQLKEELKDLQIIMLTSSMLPIDRNRAEQYDCLTDFYSKPFNPDQLAEIVDKYF